MFGRNYAAGIEFILRPHCTIVTDDSAWPVGRSVVSLHDSREHCKNGRTDQDTVWLLTRVGPMNHALVY